MISERTFRIVLCLVLLAGAAARFAVVERFGSELANDRDEYRQIGERVAAGAGFSREGHPTAYRPPLYPLLIAGVIGCGGGVRALAILQIVLGTATIAMTAALARRYVGSLGALIASGLVAVDPLLAQYTVFVMTETLFTALVTALLLALAVSPSPAAPMSRMRQAVVGLLFGLAALCRPTIWVWGSLLILWNLGMVLRSGGARNALILLRQPATLAIVAALVVLPWVIRNAMVLGAPILTTTHGGYTLLLANNPVVYREEVEKPWGTTWDDAPPGRRQSDWLNDVMRDAQHDLGPDPGEIPLDRWMSARAKQHIRDEPGTFIRSCRFRIRRLWNVAPLAPAASHLPRFVIWGVGAFYTIVFAAALVGMVRVARRQRVAGASNCSPSWAPLFLLLLSVTLVHAVYWSNARMRAPLMPVVAVLAAAAVVGARSK